MTRNESIPQVYVNGIPHEIVCRTPAPQEYREELLCIRRPNGVKHYAARWLPNEHLYGEGRVQIVCSLGRPSLEGIGDR